MVGGRTTGEATETYRLSYRHRNRVIDPSLPTQHASMRYSIQHIAASWIMNLTQPSGSISGSGQ